MPDNSVTCLRAPFDTCDAGSTNVYFMNVTNAEDVLDGISGPVFEQVGPFYFTMTKHASNEYISYPGRYGAPISALRHNYTDKVMHFHRHLSCPTCDLSVNIIGPNAIYLAMMKQTDWSESQVRNSFSPLCIHTRTGMRVRAHANWHAVSSLLCEGSPRR